jgi:hypothetical protein
MPGDEIWSLGLGRVGGCGCLGRAGHGMFLSCWWLVAPNKKAARRRARGHVLHG